MNKFKICLILTMLLMGCATTEKYEAKLNVWVGRNINDLTNAWGYPQSSFKAPDGNMVYVYGRQINVSNYGSFVCTAYFEVDNKNIVVKWRHEGNDCNSF